MRLVLVNPKQEHTISGNLPKYVDKERGNIPPLGILYAATIAKDKGWGVSVKDLSAGDALEGDAPDIVGITANTFTMVDALITAQDVKKRWGCKVMFGGMHPSIFPDETSRLENVDSVYAGEAEGGFSKYLDCYPNLPRVFVNSSLSSNLDVIPSRELTDKRKYHSLLGCGMVTTIFTSRGCPYHCIFCYRKTMGKAFRARTPAQVIDEVKGIVESGVKEILFYDDTFTVDKDRALEICTGLMGLDVKFDVRMRVDHADTGLLKALKAAGCRRIHYGVESSTDEHLKAIGKGVTVEQVRRAFYLTKKEGIETLAYFIIGSPGENTQDIKHTIQFAKDLKPDYCHFGIMTPYPATPLYELGLKCGLYGDYWGEFAKRPDATFKAPYWPELKRDDLDELLDQAYRRFYLRPGRIVKELTKPSTIKNLPRKIDAAVKMVNWRRLATVALFVLTVIVTFVLMELAWYLTGMWDV